MNEYLKKFDTIRFVATWSIFRNYLRFFFSFFKIQIWILNLDLFVTDRYRNWSGPVWPVTVVFGPVPVGKKNPGLGSATATTQTAVLDSILREPLPTAASASGSEPATTTASPTSSKKITVRSNLQSCTDSDRRDLSERSILPWNV